MALTPTEEAQTRQLLDQLSSLLSLASSEPTIISKLAATKVSLSDLSSVVTVNDTDLLLSRQGTDDKSVTVQKIKDHVKDSVSTVAFNDGTAAAPSITNNGDLDTGAYFPAANVFAVTTGGTERIRFTNTGIGVNVATPTEALQIAANIPTNGDNGIDFSDLADSIKNIAISRTHSGYSYNGISGDVGKLYSSTSLALMADTVGGNNSILFSVGGSVKAELQWDGKFGIGTTSPATTLDVNGDVTITDKIIHSGDTDTSIRFPSSDTVTVETGGAERLRVTSTGNVGIGTTSPSTPLHVETSGTSRVTIKSTTVSGRTDISTVNSSGSVTSVFGHDGTNAEIDYRAGNLQFKYIGVTQATLSTTGQLGIGTTPSEQLHITGNFRIGSAVQATPSGSAPLFAARAWVNFNSIGTVAIRASGNVTSITDNNTGDYTVNFTTAMPDADYACSFATQRGATNTDVYAGLYFGAAQSQTASSVRIQTRTGSTFSLEDVTCAQLSVFR